MAENHLWTVLDYKRYFLLTNDNVDYRHIKIEKDVNFSGFFEFGD